MVLAPPLCGWESCHFPGGHEARAGQRWSPVGEAGPPLGGAPLAWAAVMVDWGPGGVGPLATKDLV
jgi:hypothetical protein